MIGKCIRTIWMFFVWSLTSAIFTLLCVPLALLPKSIRYDNRFYFMLTSMWNHLMVWATGVTFVIKGRENLPSYPNDPSIIIMNHSSAVDIFLMEKLVGSYPHVWMCKKEYGKIPLFNILMYRMHVPVDRANPRQAIKALGTMQKLVSDGVRHALMFPEGTRHQDEKIHDFFIGFARMAVKLSRPVIPIVVTKLGSIFPKGKFLIETEKTSVKISIGKPMHARENETIQEFKDRVELWCRTEHQHLLRADR